MANNKILGNTGEDIAFEHLSSIGYRIIDRNYRCKLGEIDLIGFDRNTICFIEVKTRRSDAYGAPSDSVSSYKQMKIIKSALLYITKNKFNDYMSRFDVVEILIDSDSTGAHVNLIKDAFQYCGKYGY